MLCVTLNILKIIMMKDKKIENAARQYLVAFRDANPDGYSSSIIDIESGCFNNFKEGANWAINEFIKDLWHPANEEPQKDVTILVETHNDKNVFYYVWDKWQDNFYPSWTDAILCSRVSRWLYIDDLFPKEGDKK